MKKNRLSAGSLLKCPQQLRLRQIEAKAKSPFWVSHLSKGTEVLGSSPVASKSPYMWENGVSDCATITQCET